MAMLNMRLTFAATQAAQKTPRQATKHAHRFAATQAAQKNGTNGTSALASFAATQAAQKVKRGRA